MIRVLQVTNAYPRADLPDFGVFIQEQIESLDPALVQSEVLVIAQGGGIGGYLRSVQQVRRAARQADLVHCHHMLCGLVALLAGLRSKALVSFTSEGAKNFKRGPRWLGKLMFFAATRLSLHNIFKGPMPPGLEHKSSWLPNGVDTQRFVVGDRLEARKQLGLESDPHYVLFVSAVRMNRPEKRYDYFVQAMEALRRRRPGQFFPLTMTNVPRRTVPLYYQAASAHLLTSDVEGSPNSIKESLASGTPVVARDVGGVAGLLERVPGCGLFAGDDPEVVANLIEKAITASAQQVRLAFLSKGLDMSRIAQRLAGIYVELAAGKKGPITS